jgi:polyisoprenoid-binding protein YceI
MRTKTRTALALGTVLACCPAWPQQLELAQSEIGFTIRQFGVPVEGRFTKFGGQLAFDPKNLAAAKVSLAIDIASARFGSPDTEGEAAKAPWFNTSRYPHASIESVAFKATGPDKYELAAKLTLKGSTRDIVVPLTLARAGSLVTANGVTTLKRLDFKVGDGEWTDTSLVANEVQVKFRIAMSGVPAP